MLAQLQQKEAQEKVLTEEWTEKWRETQKILQEQKALGLRKSGQGVVLDSDMPHLVGIDDDVLSTGVTFYHLKVSITWRIGPFPLIDFKYSLRRRNWRGYQRLLMSVLCALKCMIFIISSMNTLCNHSFLRCLILALIVLQFVA